MWCVLFGINYLISLCLSSIYCRQVSKSLIFTSISKKSVLMLSFYRWKNWDLVKLAQPKVTARLCPLACAVAMATCCGSGILVAHCPHGSGSMTVQEFRALLLRLACLGLNRDSTTYANQTSLCRPVSSFQKMGTTICWRAWGDENGRSCFFLFFMMCCEAALRAFFGNIKQLSRGFEFKVESKLTASFPN